ncbi:MAG: hypothetical protein K2N11_08810, partial [Mucispirillum sp.]|nr:hypothetical protein [Mucispirillum sp.]
MSVVMKKYLLIIFGLLISLQSYSQADNGFGSMQVITPKDYFNADNVSYYFGYDGIKALKIHNSSLTIEELAVFSNHGYGHLTLSSFLNGAYEVLYEDDGSLVIYRTNSDYSCQNNTGSNCLYSPVYIRKINKKSLTGNISLYRVDNSIPLEEKDIINFPMGAELYSIVVEVPAYDFSTFTDMASLVCSKNEDNLCRGVISNGVLDKTALFELSSMKDKDKEFLFSDTGDGLVYQFNLVDNELIPYNKECVQSVVNLDDLQGCIEAGMMQGKIIQNKHPSGIIYWMIDYKNPAVDNVFFWINNRGEPFKAYTNSRLIYNFSLFNKDAADIISKLFSER